MTVPEYDSFIDLDACIQNIFGRYELELFRVHQYGEIEIADLMKFRNAYKQENGRAS